MGVVSDMTFDRGCADSSNVNIPTIDVMSLRHILNETILLSAPVDDFHF